ncbi:hypothetical protein GCM10011529_27460 [Polymorphobacter glacialis]|uniref:DUF1311 domain-containing protein n=1 Tax=Sandarakinorhabdus glacialis TaxID=1614636 RepID=A0A916ZZ17_9SPHN|nr:hypothetical protein GCM10011529_27460 [Polymorphobacter glacialis]
MHGRIAAAIIASGLIFSSAGAAGDTEQLCAKEWDGNFRMQEYCIKKGQEGAADYRAIARTYQANSAMSRALSKCFQDWTEGGLTNWRMAAYCGRKQAESYERLR